MTSQITPAGIRPGEAREVDARLGVAGALEHAAGLGLERVDVAGLDEVARAAARVDGDLDRVRAVVRRDAGRDALARLDRDRERRLQRRLVLRRHQVEAELLAALGRQREADEAARLLGHEVDRLGRHELRRHHEVALVLAVLVVADDDHPALRGSPRSPPRSSRTGCRLRSVAHRATSRSTCLARMSTSMLTRRPAPASPSVVAARVCGISAIVTRRAVERRRPSG